jgi:UDP-2,4-diacetamido-2,4,6-trideoxy-beta-L-altropyranose hydrolase
LKKLPRVLFRAAAGPRLGYGHLLRSRALARALGVSPRVSLRGRPEVSRAARALGLDLEPVVDWPQFDVAVVDDPSPRHASVWLRLAKAAGVTTVAITDLGVGSDEADLVVDGSVTAGPALDAARACRGPRFMVLDDRVLTARRVRRRAGIIGRPKVLIALGGGSHVVSAVGRLVQGIRRACPGAEIEVAAGFTRGPRPRLAGARWIVRRDGLIGDLARADIAVVSGGITLYEACAVGVPSVALAVVSAQRHAVEAFAVRGAVIDAGVTTDPLAANRVGHLVAAFAASGAMRRQVAAAGRSLVDGRGAMRLAARLRLLAAPLVARRRE